MSRQSPQEILGPFLVAIGIAHRGGQFLREFFRKDVLIHVIARRSGFGVRIVFLCGGRLLPLADRLDRGT